MLVWLYINLGGKYLFVIAGPKDPVILLFIHCLI
jgi:hypothetical protein